MNNNSASIYTADNTEEQPESIYVEHNNCHYDESLTDHAYRVFDKKNSNDTSPLFKLSSTILKRAQKIDTKRNLQSLTKDK